MMIIRHRVNSWNKLKSIPESEGVEIDLRSSRNDIYLHHDPFKKGVLFEKWIKFFKHKFIVLNVKEEGLEKRLIERWENFNLPKKEIDEKVYKNDLPNGVNVLKNSIAAEYILEN